MKCTKYLLLTMFSVLNTGCSSVDDVEPAVLTFDKDSFSSNSIAASLDLLSESAEVAANAQKAMAELSNGLAAKQMTRKEYNEYIFQKSYVPLGMERSVGDIDWAGDALPLLRLVADMAGYVVAEPANKPLFEPQVSLDTTDTSKDFNVMDVIRAVEAANKEEISIDILEKSKIVNINYYY